jgi:putative phage-type endonuclease
MTSTLDTVATPAGAQSTLLLTVDAPREEWLAARRQGIGGSDASIVAGVNRFGSRYELWLDKTGQRPLDDGRVSDAIEFGRRAEPMLRAWFTELTGIQVRRSGLRANRQRPWQLASVDGDTSDGGILECKTTSWRMADEWADDQVADHAEAQTQHYLAVTGRSHAWVFALVDRSPVIRRVDRDEQLIADLTAMEERFWFDHVVARVEPTPLTAKDLAPIKSRFSSVTTESIDVPRDEIRPVLDRWLAAKAVAKAAETDVEDAEAHLRQLIGGAEEVRVDGVPVLTCKANGTFSTKAFTAAHPDAAEACTVAKPALDLDLVKSQFPAEYAAHRARVLRPTKAA